MFRPSLGILLLSVVIFCGPARDLNSNHFVALTPAEIESYSEQINAEREEADDYFRNHPESPIAAVARIQGIAKDSAAIQFIVQIGNEFKLQPSDSTTAVLGFKYDGQSFQNIQPASGLELEGQPYTGEKFSDAVIQGQRYVFALYGAGTIIIYDLTSPAREQFAGKEYFPIDSRWQLEGNMVASDSQKIVQIPTSRGLVKQFRIAGTVELQVYGKPVRLTLFQSAGASEDSDDLFLPFTDQTTGKSTYHTGRYLDLKKPAPGHSLIVDFNQAYYPLCYFSPHFNCPVPPAENRIAFAITAGEKGVHAQH